MNNQSTSIGRPEVESFFDSQTNTISHVVIDKETNKVAVIDSVLDYEANSAEIYYDSANRIIDFIEKHGYQVEWIIETHAHADHLSAAPYIQEKLGGKLAINKNINIVQDVFGKVFNFGTEYAKDASQFDYLFEDEETFKIGNLNAKVIHTPGHTPADSTIVIEDAAFVGDTLFMPDFGTARCDFPGGSAEDLYDSIQKIFTLPKNTRLFMCHDYLPEGRTEFKWETTVAEQIENNIHVSKNKNKSEFVELRTKRDKTLNMPKLIIPSIQLNINAGKLPKAEENQTQYLKIPLNKFNKL